MELTDAEARIMRGRTSEERLFWRIDDVVVALAPDAPEETMAEWCKLYDRMPPDLIELRKRLRCPTPAA